MLFYVYVSQGWEESVDAAVSHLLKTCLSRSPKDQAISLSSGPLSIPKDTSRLKKHITLLCDRLGKGGRLSLSSEANVPTTVMMPGQKHVSLEAVMQRRAMLALKGLCCKAQVNMVKNLLFKRSKGIIWSPI